MWISTPNRLNKKRNRSEWPVYFAIFHVDTNHTWRKHCKHSVFMHFVHASEAVEYTDFNFIFVVFFSILVSRGVKCIQFWFSFFVGSNFHAYWDSKPTISVSGINDLKNKLGTAASSSSQSRFPLNLRKRHVNFDYVQLQRPTRRTILLLTYITGAKNWP